MSRPTSTSTSPSCIEDVLQPGDDHGAYEFGLDLLLDGSDNHCTTRPPTRRTEPLPKTPDLACATTQTKEAMEMPKVSRDSAPQRQEAGPVVDLRGELDGYTVSFTSVLEDIDATPLMKGLPDDRCPCPHWGYVLKGKMTARYADRDEVFEAGDAFYTPPGHVPVQHEPGTEFVWFSPSEELRTAEAVMMKNMQAMQDGSTP
jgi:hypothetical protein